MKTQRWKVYAFWIGLSEAVGFLAGLLTMEATKLYSQTIEQPPFSPPMWLFPVAWGILYALMGISAARIWLAEESAARKWALNLFVAQLIVNFFWPLIFFNLQAFGLGLVWLILLWVLVLALILVSRRVDRSASWLLVPYLTWLTFAVYLNAGVLLLN